MNVEEAKEQVDKFNALVKPGQYVTTRDGQKLQTLGNGAYTLQFGTLPVVRVETGRPVQLSSLIDPPGFALIDDEE